MGGVLMVFMTMVSHTLVTAFHSQERPVKKLRSIATQPSVPSAWDENSECVRSFIHPIQPRPRFSPNPLSTRGRSTGPDRFPSLRLSSGHRHCGGLHPGLR